MRFQSRFLLLPVLFLLFFIQNTHARQTMNIKLLYVYDALCGWCFGFSPVVRQLVNEHGDKVTVEIISGGLRIDDAVGTIDEVAPFIRTAYKSVENTTGIKFGEAFVQGPLARGDMRLNSLPPAKALAIFRKTFPEKALEFASALHNMVYVDGFSPEDETAIARYAESLGYPREPFLEAFRSPEADALARADFAKARQLGVQGYPCLLKENNGRWEVISSGYIPYQKLLKLLGI